MRRVIIKLSAEETSELRGAVRGACERFATEERVRDIAFGGGGGFDTELWQLLCSQIGVAAISLPEKFGGAGYGVCAAGVVSHELGRMLAPVPFLASSVLATGLIADSGEAAIVGDVISALADGTRTAAAVLTGDGGGWDRRNVTVTASPAGHGWELTGTVHHVLNGTAADELVVIATTDGALGVYLLHSTTAGFVAEAERVLDATRPMATLTFRAAAATRLSGDGLVEDVIDRNINRAIAVLSAEQVGSCERVLEIATEYAGMRQQFGRPIGSFQAIKHKCADMLVDLEWSRSASQAVLESFDAQDGETSWRASMAKAVCSESLRGASHANLQIHGGIGFTWADSAHLYLKRARTDEVLFGGPSLHWERLAATAKLL